VTNEGNGEGYEYIPHRHLLQKVEEGTHDENNRLQPSTDTTMTTTTTTKERGARGINIGDDDGAAQEKERGVGFRVY